MADITETPLGSTGKCILINKTKGPVDIILKSGVEFRLGAYNREMVGNVSEPIDANDIPDSYKKNKGIVCKEVLA